MNTEIVIAQKQKRPIVSLLRSLGSSYSSGFFSGTLLIMAVHFLEKDSESHESWFLSAFLLVSGSINTYVGWKSHKNDCADLARLIEQQETSSATGEMP